MRALTPALGLELAGTAQVSPLNVSGLQSLPSPTTSPLPLVAFIPNPSAPGALPLFAGPGFALRSQARQSARPNRVRVPTDDFFTSCCSPPRLAATQLQSVTGRSGHAWKGLSPCQPNTLTDARPPASSRPHELEPAGSRRSGRVSRSQSQPCRRPRGRSARERRRPHAPSESDARCADA